MAKSLKTVDAVIDELGGTAVTAKITGRQMQHVSNWRSAGRMPSNTFLILTTALEKKGATAPPDLWGIPQSLAS